MRLAGGGHSVAERSFTAEQYQENLGVPWRERGSEEFSGERFRYPPDFITQSGHAQLSARGAGIQDAAPKCASWLPIVACWPDREGWVEKQRKSVFFDNARGLNSGYFRCVPTSNDISAPTRSLPPKGTRAVCLAYLRAPFQAAAISLPLLASLHMHSVAGGMLAAVGVLLLVLALNDLSMHGTLTWGGLSAGRRPLWWISIALAGFVGSYVVERVGRGFGLMGVGGSGLLLVLASVWAYRSAAHAARLVSQILGVPLSERAWAREPVPSPAVLLIALGVLTGHVLAASSGLHPTPRLLPSAISLAGVIWLVAHFVAREPFAPTRQSSLSR